MSRKTPEELSELGGKVYIAGYILRKFKEVHPELVLTYPENTRNPQSFTQQKSDGNLTVPNCPMMTLFHEFEQYFLAFHNHSGDKWKVNRSYNVISYLTDRIHKKYTTTSKDLIRYYVRIRTFIRISYINKRLEFGRAMKRNARKATQFSGSQLVELDEEEDDGVFIPNPEEILNEHSYFENLHD